MLGMAASTAVYRDRDVEFVAVPATIPLTQTSAEQVADALVEHPRFSHMVRHMCANLASLFDATPRVGKLLGSQRRWFMVQIGFALHHRGLCDPAFEGLTASRLAEIIEDLDIASRNTVTAFLAEMKAYRFIQPRPGTEKRRSRPLEPTEAANRAIGRWIGANLAGLDDLDGGNRAAMFASRPDLMPAVQKAMIDLMIPNDMFTRPEPRVANFLGRESGGLVLDGLIAAIEIMPDRPDLLDGAELLRLGKLNISALARRFQLSRINLDRMIRDAEAQGSVRRLVDGGHAIRADFLALQLRRQAVKFAAIELAWLDALARTERTAAR